MSMSVRDSIVLGVAGWSVSVSSTDIRYFEPTTSDAASHSSPESAEFDMVTLYEGNTTLACLMRMLSLAMSWRREPIGSAIHPGGREYREESPGKTDGKAIRFGGVGG